MWNTYACICKRPRIAGLFALFDTKVKPFFHKKIFFEIMVARPAFLENQHKIREKKFFHFFKKKNQHTTLVSTFVKRPGKYTLFLVFLQVLTLGIPLNWYKSSISKINFFGAKTSKYKGKIHGIFDDFRKSRFLVLHANAKFPGASCSLY